MKHLKNERIYTERLYKMYIMDKEEEGLIPEGYGYVYMPTACGNSDDFLTPDESRNSIMHMKDKIRFKDRNFNDDEINLFYDDTINKI